MVVPGGRISSLTLVVTSASCGPPTGLSLLRKISLALPTSPEEGIDATSGRVNGLVTSGALTQDQADGLLAKLRQARANLDAGRTEVTVREHA